MARLRRPEVRRAALHDDHRERHRHPVGEHDDRQPRRHVRALAALPAPRPRRPQQGARLRVPAGARATLGDPGRAAAARGAAGIHRARRRLPHRLARPGDPRRGQPARARPVRARSRRSGSTSTRSCSRRRWPRCAASRRGRRSSPRSRCRSRRCSRTTTCPTCTSGWCSTSGSAAPGRPTRSSDLRAELVDRCGELPDEVDALSEVMLLKAEMRELRLRALESGAGAAGGHARAGRSARPGEARGPGAEEQGRVPIDAGPQAGRAAGRAGSAGSAARRGEEGAAGSRGVRTLLSRGGALSSRWTSRSTGAGTHTGGRSVPAGDEVVDTLLAVP